ncbi:TetR/AcrR family transcriptional regulator [Silvimonas iriomotensis]|uniref:HTH tetR-type domain-containing protein n=1 Tax=Silvimonas iriomotensis TaxID=449662 RepID=A0ABQ2PA30_9NEIS|nr:TetR/AcrR family transcriptional regulator [Silvimonas iriomotensis]GGP21505.1 hypothetical protein GCM10010970_20810 [Silvimonas iriomotensis]
MSRLPKENAAVPLAQAVAPQRERGRLRVAAILEAAALVFVEKGYDKATMTEIAARSGTAIGSLYRFFPTKGALADNLLLRYAHSTVSGLAELAEQADRMTLEGLAEALVDLREDLLTQRAVVLALVDAREGSQDIRQQFREHSRAGMSQVLQKAIPGLPATRAHAMAVLMLHVLKGAATASAEDPATRHMVLAEMRELLRSWLFSARQAVAATSA